MVRAGAGMTDITPMAGMHLGGSGMGEHRPAQSVIDPLHAKAVVFEQDGRMCCLVSLDVVILTEECTQVIRKAAAERFAIAPEAVMVHAIQTHSAPGCGRFMLDPDFPLDLPPDQEYLTGSERPYLDFATQRAIEAIGQAVESLRPVEVAAGSGVCDRLAFNRRGVMRDGSIGMPWPVGRRAQPLGPTNLRYLEGPSDPEVGVFCARTDDMRMAAMLLHFTCHPVNVFGTRSSYYAVSADWPGAWGAAMQAHYGDDCVPLVLNGCCGNVNPWDPWDPDFLPDHRRMGRALTEMGCRVVESLRFKETDKLTWRTRRVPLGYRDVPAERRAEVEAILAADPRPKWCADDTDRIDSTWFQAASTKSIDYCRRRMPEFQYEVQAFRVGDTAFVGLPGEPFVEGQLELKIKSPAEFTYVAHCTSHYVGYIPTRAAAARGGHEANFSCTYWAKLEAGALDKIVAAAVEMLEECWGEE